MGSLHVLAAVELLVRPPLVYALMQSVSHGRRMARIAIELAKEAAAKDKSSPEAGLIISLPIAYACAVRRCIHSQPCWQANDLDL